MQMTREKMAEIFPGSLFRGGVKFMEPMRLHTSLRLGGPADIFLTPDDAESAMEAHGLLRKHRIPFTAVGGGTNILVRDGGMEGAVVCLNSMKRIEILDEDNEAIVLSADAGALLPEIVMLSKKKGYAGAEGLAGIPGTVGGAVWGNVGAFGCEIKDILISVDLLMPEGLVKQVSVSEIPFAYRTSGLPDDTLILRARMRLRKDSVASVSERIEHFLRTKRQSQPISEKSAGCVFKNPPGLYAGRLIEDAGCKGIKVGGVEVSNLHANFFVNKGEGTASDFITLMERVAVSVREKTGVGLEPEIRVVGRK